MRVLAISEKFNDYARDIAARLSGARVRAEANCSDDKIGAKIRLAQIAKIPYMLIVGAKEAESHSVSVRHSKRGDEGSHSVDEFLGRIEGEIRSRAL